MDMYGRTKLFNIMSSCEFNRRLKDSGVESFSCHPGVAKTNLYAPEKMDKNKLTSKVDCPHNLWIHMMCIIQMQPALLQLCNSRPTICNDHEAWMIWLYSRHWHGRAYFWHALIRVYLSIPEAGAGAVSEMALMRRS